MTKPEDSNSRPRSRSRNKPDPVAFKAKEKKRQATIRAEMKGLFELLGAVLSLPPKQTLKTTLLKAIETIRSQQRLIAALQREKNVTNIVEEHKFTPEEEELYKELMEDESFQACVSSDLSESSPSPLSSHEEHSPNPYQHQALEPSPHTPAPVQPAQCHAFPISPIQPYAVQSLHHNQIVQPAQAQLAGCRPPVPAQPLTELNVTELFETPYAPQEVQYAQPFAFKGSTDFLPTPAASCHSISPMDLLQNPNAAGEPLGLSQSGGESGYVDAYGNFVPSESRHLKQVLKMGTQAIRPKKATISHYDASDTTYSAPQQQQQLSSNPKDVVSPHSISKIQNLTQACLMQQAQKESAGSRSPPSFMHPQHVMAAGQYNMMGAQQLETCGFDQEKYRVHVPVTVTPVSVDYEFCPRSSSPPATKRAPEDAPSAPAAVPSPTPAPPPAAAQPMSPGATKRAQPIYSSPPPAANVSAIKPSLVPSQTKRVPKSPTPRSPRSPVAPLSPKADKPAEDAVQSLNAGVADISLSGDGEEEDELDVAASLEQERREILQGLGGSASQLSTSTK